MNLNTPYTKYKKSVPCNSVSPVSTILGTSSKPVKRPIDTVDDVNHVKHAMPNTSKTRRYNVLFRKYTNKKHKTWEGDGTLYLYSTNIAIIKDSDGVVLGKVRDATKYIFKGVFKCGTLECELDEDIISSKVPKMTLNNPCNSPLRRNSLSGLRSNFVSPLSKPIQQQHQQYQQQQKQQQPEPNNNQPQVFTSTPDPKPNSIVNNKFKPLLRKKKQSLDKPLYNISEIENPLVMKKPPCEDHLKNYKALKDVIVDPSLSNKLRPHQRDGVRFLYDCIMGFKSEDIHGAILADEMGLGKTLQAITLIWTLLRQSPFVNELPVLKKVLICCPVTLVNNWKKEFSKWLGLNRLNVLAIIGDKYQNEKQDIQLFGSTNVNQVLIIGYEKMHSMSNDLNKIDFDLLVCDEGHRLKNSSNKILQTLQSFNIPRKILLSGTPIQNDLTEFFNIVDFTVPDILGDFKNFQKYFMKPILKSREANCLNRNLVNEGKSKSKELIELTKKFILRRCNNQLTKYLPKRSDYILFAEPTGLQLQLFQTIIETKKFNSILNNTGNSNDSLSLITTFRKVCNSPSLLKEDGLFLEIVNKSSTSTEDQTFRNQLAKKIKSGKILLLIKLICLIHNEGKEKIVIVSNFTKTLDILENLLVSLKLTFLRLDGSTPSKDRDKIVRNFNEKNCDSSFAFLLSSKSGGCGLNLIGASRLILFDNDWNPSVDLQALSRIHRDGQKKPVKIYRLLTKSCIDEKIFQRQLVKLNLSNKFLDNSNGTSLNQDFFDDNDLKDIFTVGESSNCNTHELMNCKCAGNGDSIISDVDGHDKDDENETEDEVENQNENENENENENDENDDNDNDDDDDDVVGTEPEAMNFMSALDYTQKYDADDNQIERTQRKLKKCLKGFKHIDPIKYPQIKTDDEILNSIMSSQERDKPLISYMFGRY